MGVLVALMVGLVFWLSYWALGFKAFDGFLVAMGLVIAAAAWRLLSPWIKDQLGPG